MITEFSNQSSSIFHRIKYWAERIGDETSKFAEDMMGTSLLTKVRMHYNIISIEHSYLMIGKYMHRGSGC